MQPSSAIRLRNNRGNQDKPRPLATGARFRAFADLMPQLAWMARADGSAFWRNRRWYEYTGMTPEEAAGSGWQRVHHPDYLPRALEHWRQALQTGETFAMEVPIKNAAGQYHWFLVCVCAFRSAKGKIKGWIGTETDIDDQVAMRQRLADAEATLKRALDAARMGTWVLDPATHVITIDSMGLSVLGIDLPEYTGDLDFVHARVHPDDQQFLKHDLQQFIAHSNQIERNYRVVWPDGGVHWVQSQGRVFRNEAGQAYRITGTLFDITAKRAVEAMLEQAVAARDQLLSIASHEMKTPLTSLKLQSEMIQRATERSNGHAVPAERVAKFLGTCCRQIARLEALLDDLFDASKLESGRLRLSRTKVHLSALIRDVVEGFAPQLAQARCRLELQLDEAIEGFWDAGRLAQVVTNLLTNAVKYAAGSPIEIVATHTTRSTCLVTVKDRGPGIAPHYQPLIFDRFARGATPQHVSGMGLGLFIVKQIVESHHGSIALKSAVGEGTQFTVELPV